MILVLVSGIGILVAWLYYRGENLTEDPRVAGARKLLLQYDRLMKEGKYDAGLPILDSVEVIYRGVTCYAESYEMGVISNNRGSSWLSMALYMTDDSLRKAEMLVVAEKEIRHSIEVYQTWLNHFDSVSTAELKNIVLSCFPENDKAFKGINYMRLVEKRIKDMNLAKVENKRRLSVAWSNLGIIQRHQYKQDSAIGSYLTALKMWRRNPTAKNNLNTLLGKPSEDESVIENLFPPDRRKPD